MSSLYFCIYICCVLTPVQNFPVQVSHDSQQMDTFGDVTASDYSEWRHCLGFRCDVWKQAEKELQWIQCLNSNDDNCMNKKPTDTIEGDLFLTPHQIHNFYQQVTHSGRKKRKIQTFNEKSKIWSLPIHYMFDETYKNNYTAKYIVRQALSHWESQTCITFQEVQDAKNVQGPYVMFISGDHCGSFIGQIPVLPQPVRVSASCHHVASIAHEIGHLIGFWHEHQRTDRDNYVIINGQHAITEKHRKLSLEFIGETSNFVPYDYASLMQYWAWAFTKSGQQTITPRDIIYSQTMGQKVGLSFLDSKLANIAYCPYACDSALPNPCLHGGYQDPLKCEQCRCPDGLGGRFCEGVAESVKADCSEMIVLDEGEMREITSPGYHDNIPYGDGVQCNWVLKTSRPNQRLVVKLDGSKFGIYCNKKVCFHWLEVKYHRDQSLTGPRLCCEGQPVLSIRSEGQQMTLTLRANYPSSASERTGFKVTVTCERYCGQPAGEVLSTEKNFNCDRSENLGEQNENTKTIQASYPLCSHMDLAIAFDETWSSSVRFHNVIDFLKQFVSQFRVDADHVQIGFVHFGSSAYIKYSLTDLPSLADVINAVSALSSNTGKTNMAAAFKLLRTEFFTTSEGSRAGVPNVCVVLVNSDAKKDQQHTVVEAEQLKQVASIWTIGTGWANVRELEEITGSSDRVSYQNTVKGLIDRNVAKDVYNSICEVVVQSDAVTDSAPQEQKVLTSAEATTVQKTGVLEWSCDFEMDTGMKTWCGMVQVDSASWILLDDRFAGSPITAHSGHVCLYLTGPSTPSKIYIPVHGILGPQCLSFYILLSGHQSNQLEVLVQGTSPHYSHIVWQLAGDFGLTWYFVEIDTHVTANQQITILGTPGEPTGQIGIDNIVITPDRCYKN